MALAHTDRGDSNFGEGLGSGRTVTSASFTPTNGALLTACGYMIVNDAAALSDFTITSTGFTTGGWTEKTTTAVTDTGTFSLRSGVWVAVVTSSAAGTVTLTRPLLNGVDYWLVLQVDEWTGQAASQAGALFGSANDADATGTTLTVPFGGTPVSTSGAVGIVGDNNAPTTGAVQPTGWTESADIGDPTHTGNSSDAAWILTGAQASPQWTSLQSGTFGKVGSVLEILDASAPPSFVAPTIIVPKTAITRSYNW